jgi:hypothetical protein
MNAIGNLLYLKNSAERHTHALIIISKYPDCTGQSGRKQAIGNLI